MYKKTAYLSILGILCLFLSCQKKTDISSNQSFNLDYSDTLLLGTNCSNVYSLGLNFTGTSATISIAGLPSNVTVTPTSIPLTTGSNTPLFTFSGNGVTPGIYPVQLNIATSGNDMKTYYMYLKVQSSQDIASQMVGEYDISSCGNDGTNEITTSGNNDLYITNINAQNNNLNVNAVVIPGCVSNGDIPISIPLQTVNGFTIHGSGACYNDGVWIITIRDTITSASGTNICSLQMDEF